MKFINILFWNLNNNILYKSIEEMCYEHDVDILVLCEYFKVDIEHLVRKLESRNLSYTVANKFIEGKRVVLLYKIGYEIKSIADTKYYSGYLINNDGLNILLFGVHLPSKLRSMNQDQYSVATKTRREIEIKEEELNIYNTIVIGDFNMNPFEDGMVSADGFHGVMNKQTALKRNRIIYGEEKKFFYNPMWHFMGNGLNDVMGTYYYNKSGVINYYWNTFDQVLIRPNLIEKFHMENLKIINLINKESIIKNNIPLKNEYSDHLPILFTI